MELDAAEGEVEVPRRLALAVSGDDDETLGVGSRLWCNVQSIAGRACEVEVEDEEVAVFAGQEEFEVQDEEVAFLAGEEEDEDEEEEDDEKEGRTA